MTFRFNTDSLNPVLVKELRQSFHGKLFPSLLIILLAVQLIVLFMFYLDMSREGHTPNGNEGESMFYIIYAIFGVGSVILCAFSPQYRFSKERQNPDLDFTRFCDMTPFQILLGKFFNSLIILVYLFSLCLPFMVIAYFLHGISILEMLAAMCIILLTLFVFIQLSLLLGSFGKKSLTPLVILMLFWCGPAFIGMLLTARHSTTMEAIGLISTAAFCLLLGFLFLFVASLGILAPPYANRTMPLRIFMCALIPVTPIVGIGLSFHFGNPVRPEHIIVPIICAFAAIGSFIACMAAWERPSAGVRVLRNCPRQPLGRFCYFLISSGTAGGLTLAWIFAILATLSGFLYYIIIPITSIDFNDFLFFNMQYAFYAIFYTEVTIWLKKRWNQPPAACWLLVVVVLFCLPLLGNSILATTRNDMSIYICTTPFHLLWDNFHINSHIDLLNPRSWFGAFFALGGLLCSGKYLVEQFSSFKRAEG